MQLTVRDVARLFAVSEKTVYRWLDQKTLPVYRVNNMYRFNRAELLEWAMANRINVSAELFSEPESADSPLQGLGQALRAGGIYYRVGGTDKASALRSVVELIHLPPEVDRQFLLNVLLAREEMASTGIGDGIAIPHVRNPIVLHVPQPTVSLCFLEKPIDFKAIDGRPVYCLFTIVSPTVRAHLHLLSRLSYALRDAALKHAIEIQASRDEIFSHIGRIEADLDAPQSPLPDQQKEKK
ncbi:MAG TPA: PTS sugar transporter subunit IIA [Anaerohalosphaeraceae bacterium]|nr:PTS sugar transporter subunit IIA [Phycisphaerae bacterium]HOK95159.1 PTS sugar transporter subunit IIA [Anaerohalosphaeraceae bacterium]HOL31056.1 PTS sugar transporter subunit IIA [Anaerohalosphaeraceae bacterium]HOM75876.1 PTS sugar transporter subunit IIA [Anaerohalosphaeraceae bacterium]HPC64149.1 PTS sugar transporter subunit IIA [Anaerohalosphaeraceae bacterium]